MEYYLTTNTDEELMYAATRSVLKTLYKVKSASHKKPYVMNPLVQNIQNRKIHKDRGGRILAGSGDICDGYDSGRGVKVLLVSGG